MQLPAMTAEASLGRAAGFRGIPGDDPGDGQVLPAATRLAPVSPLLDCNAACLGSYGIGCAIFCRSDLFCQQQCIKDAIAACCSK